MNDLVVRQERSIVRQHVDDSRLAGCLESTIFVTVVDFRLDFVFALAFGTFLFRVGPEQRCSAEGMDD